MEYCEDFVIVEGDINGYFDYLEKIGEIKFGKYDVFWRIFKIFNVRVVDYIDKILVKINFVLRL